METKAIVRGVRLSSDKGRLVADLIRGKKKPQFTSHLDTGDFVVVVKGEGGEHRSSIVWSERADLARRLRWAAGVTS